MTPSFYKKITSNFSWQMLDRFIRGGGTVLINIYIGRKLGALGFGELNYCLAILSFFQVISTFGLDSIIVKKLSTNGEKDKVETVIHSALLLKLFMSIFASLLCIIYAFVFESHNTLNGIMILSFSLIFSFLDVFKSYFESKYQIKYFVISEFISFTVFSILKILNLIYLKDASLLFWTFSIEYILGKLILAFIFLKKSDHRIYSPQFRDKEMLIVILREGFPLMLASFSVILYMRIDQVMIGRMLGNESLGLFSAAVRLSEAWYFVPVALCSALFPYLVNLHGRNIHEFKAKSQLLYDLMSTLSACFFFVVIISPSFWITLLFGNDFVSAAPILAIHAGAGFFVALGVASNYWLNIHGFSQIILGRTVIGACLNLILNLFLINKMGAIGCALATLISQGISVFSIFLLKDTRECGYQMLRSFNLVLSAKRLSGFYLDYRKRS